MTADPTPPTGEPHSGPAVSAISGRRLARGRPADTIVVVVSADADTRREPPGRTPVCPAALLLRSPVQVARTIAAQHRRHVYALRQSSPHPVTCPRPRGRYNPSVPALRRPAQDACPGCLGRSATGAFCFDTPDRRHTLTPRCISGERIAYPGGRIREPPAAGFLRVKAAADYWHRGTAVASYPPVPAVWAAGTLAKHPAAAGELRPGVFLPCRSRMAE